MSCQTTTATSDFLFINDRRSAATRSAESETRRAEADLLPIACDLGDSSGRLAGRSGPILVLALVGLDEAHGRALLDSLVGVGESFDIHASILDADLHARKRLGTDGVSTVLGRQSGRLGADRRIPGESGGGDCCRISI